MRSFRKPSGQYTVMLKPHVLLRIEGAVVLAVALLVYNHGGFPWWIYAAAFLVPGVGLLGYP